MPEGPEIKRSADAIARAIARQPVTEIFFAFDHLKPYEEKLKGDVIFAVQPRGKALLTRFEQGLNIYSHNQLYGVWMIQPAHQYPDTSRQLRLAIHTEQHSALLYSASDIAVLHNEELAIHPFLSRIGPDVLDPATTVEQVVSRLTDNQFRRRQLTSLLLDQQFLSGLGNYLRSEILFAARLHPHLRPMECTPEQLQDLAQAAIALPRQSYETGGITNELARAMQMKADGVPRADYRFCVFDREGQPCFTCGTPILKEMTGGRRCYLCPRCQPTKPGA